MEIQKPNSETWEESTEVPESKKVYNIGDKVGKLTVLGNHTYFICLSKRKQGKHVRVQFVVCQCECGIKKYIRTSGLKRKDTLSCGCLWEENRLKILRKGTKVHNGQKKCSSCLETKPITEFSRCKDTIDSYLCQCNRCRKSTILKCSYGITVDDYDKLFELQDGKCKICKRSEKLHVDHCHTSGKIRSLLCKECNQALGLFREEIQSLQAAIDYLQSH